MRGALCLFIFYVKLCTKQAYRCRQTQRHTVYLSDILSLLLVTLFKKDTHIRVESNKRERRGKNSRLSTSSSIVIACIGHPLVRRDTDAISGEFDL